MSVPSYLKAIASRRTFYKLKPELPSDVSIGDIQSIVQELVKQTPTAYNSQVNRAVILTGETHRKVWDHVVSSLPEGAGRKRPQSVRDEAYGSVIFFTDDATTEQLQSQFPQWSSIFPQFADHTSGALQINSWTVLEQLGLGAHLQHFNAFVRDALPEDVPSAWNVHAQLVFGAPAAKPEEKTFSENPVKIYN